MVLCVERACRSRQHKRRQQRPFGIHPGHETSDHKEAFSISSMFPRRTRRPLLTCPARAGLDERVDPTVNQNTPAAVRAQSPVRPGDSEANMMW